MNTMEPLFAGQLLAALKRLAREFGLNFAFKDAGQLAKRLINDRKLLNEAEFTITHEHRKKQKSKSNHRNLQLGRRSRRRN